MTLNDDDDDMNIIVATEFLSLNCRCRRRNTQNIDTLRRMDECENQTNYEAEQSGSSERRKKYICEFASSVHVLNRRDIPNKNI